MICRISYFTYGQMMISFCARQFSLGFHCLFKNSKEKLRKWVTFRSQRVLQVHIKTFSFISEARTWPGVISMIDLSWNSYQFYLLCGSRPSGPFEFQIEWYQAIQSYIFSTHDLFAILRSLRLCSFKFYFWVRSVVLPNNLTALLILISTRFVPFRPLSDPNWNKQK